MPPTDNAKLSGTCKSCGWPVVFLLCNDALATTPPYSGSDWWMYCSNPTCEHHSPGEDVWQGSPEWVDG
jgi:hypothetical protein